MRKFSFTSSCNLVQKLFGLRNLAGITLLACLVPLVGSCDFRPLTEPGNTHYVRVYLNERIPNTTEGFYNPDHAKPSFRRPDVMRVALADRTTGRVVAERYLRSQGDDGKGHYYDGYIICDPGEWSLLAWNFDTEATLVSNPSDISSATAYTNVIAQEGDIIKTGRLWLIDADDNVMRFYSEDNINVASGEVTIKNIKRGVYTLCILANCKELDSYVEGSKIDEFFKRKLLPTISDGSAPAFTEETGMPCSAVIHQEITVGENYVEAHLQRCVGRLSIRIRNNIGDSKIAIGAVGLSKNNPSTGYLFEPLDSSVPPTVTNLSFKELTGITTIAPYETKEVYDSYLYEIDASTAANGITFDLLGGIYDAAVSDEDISIAYRTQYNFGKNLSTLGDVSGNKYLIRSVESSTRYVGYTGETRVGTGEFTEDAELEYFKDTPNYLWEFVGNSSSAKLKNVKTGNYLDENLNMTADAAKAQTFTITNNAGKFLFGYTREYWWSSSTYYITYDAGKLSVQRNNTGTTAQWYLRLLDESSINEPYFVNALREIPREARPIHYVDKYGAHNKLERIDRNEHITVTVNIFYNREMGEFKFEVEGWSGKDSETTFD